GERGEDEPGQPRGKDRVALGDPGHRVDDLVAGDGLRDVAAGAGADDADHVLGRVGNAQREELGVGIALEHLLRDLRSPTAGEVDIEQDDVGAGLPDHPDGLIDVPGLAHDVDAVADLGAYAGAE